MENAGISDLPSSIQKSPRHFTDTLLFERKLLQRQASLYFLNCKSQEMLG